MAGTSELARTVYPPVVRSRQAFYGHFHGCATAEGGPALYEIQRGRGRIMVFTQAILTAYLQTGYHAHRALLLNALHRAIPQPLVETDAPSIMDITLGRKDGNRVLQAMPFVADRRHRYSFEAVNEAVALGPCTVSVLSGAPVARVWNPVDGTDFPFGVSDGAVRFTLPAITEHTVILIENAG